MSENQKTPARRTGWTDGQTTRRTDGQTYNTPNMIYDLSKTKKNETKIMIISFRIEEALYTEKKCESFFPLFVRSLKSATAPLPPI